MSKIADEELIRNLRLGRAVRAKTLRLLRGLSQDCLDHRPTQSGTLVGEKGNWSLGEHADHILRVESYIRKEVFEKLIEMSRSAQKPVLRLTVADVNLSPAFIPEFLLRPSEVLIDLSNRLSSPFVPRRVTERLIRSTVFPVRTPEPWNPVRGRPGEGLRDDLSTSLDTMEELFEQNASADFQAMTFVHTIIGRHTLPQLVKVIVIHEEWHQDRMIEVLSNLSLQGTGASS